MSERFHTAAVRLAVAPANSDAHILVQSCAIQDRVPSVNSTQRNRVTAGRPRKVSVVDQVKKFCATLSAEKLCPADNTHARRSATLESAVSAKWSWNKPASAESIREKSSAILLPMKNTLAAPNAMECSRVVFIVVRRNVTTRLAGSVKPGSPRFEHVHVERSQFNHSE